MAPREEPESVYPSRTGELNAPGSHRELSERMPRHPRGEIPNAGGRPPNRLGRVAHRIYICSAEGNTGKSTVALGALDTLSRRATRVGVFRPISRSTEERDYVLDLLLAHDGVVPIEYDEAIGVSYDEVHADPDAGARHDRAALQGGRGALRRRRHHRLRLHRCRQSRPSSATTPASPRTSAPPCCSCSAAASARAAGASERLGHAERAHRRRARPAHRARHRGARPRARDPPRHRREPRRPRAARRHRRPGRRGRAVGGRRRRRASRRSPRHPSPCGPSPRTRTSSPRRCARSWRPSTASCTRATPTCSTARRSAS